MIVDVGSRVVTAQLNEIFEFAEEEYQQKKEK